MLQQGSLFDPVNLYIIKRCESAKNIVKSISYVKTLGQSSNSLCFIYFGESPPAPLKSIFVEQKAALIPCYQPWPNETPQVVRYFAHSVNLKLTKDGAQALLAANGDDLALNLNELRRLKCIFGDEPRALDSGDLAPHLNGMRSDEAAQLERLLLQQQWAKAQALSSQLLKRGERALPILAILTSHIRTTLKVLDSFSKGHKNPASLAQTAQVPPFVIKNYLPLVQRVKSPASYQTALAECHQADVLLKSRRCHEDLVLACIIDALAMT
jgi:DNA polymerase III delta subunit